MSEQQVPMTYERFMEMMDRLAADADRRQKEYEQWQKEYEQRQKEYEQRQKERQKEYEQRRAECEQRQAEYEQRQAEYEQRQKEDQAESKQRQKDLDRQFQETDRKISALGSRVGQIVEHMVGGGIIRKFQELGYEIKRLSRNTIFGEIGTKEQGEVDLTLYDGDVVILIEVKTNLKTDDVLDHVARMEKYRRSVDRPGEPDKHRYIGAVAGAVVEPNVADFAQKQGMYVIVQSGDAVEILPPPEGFVVKTW